LMLAKVMPAKELKNLNSEIIDTQRSHLITGGGPGTT